MRLPASKLSEPTWSHKRLSNDKNAHQHWLLKTGAHALHFCKHVEQSGHATSRHMYISFGQGQYYTKDFKSPNQRAPDLGHLAMCRSSPIRSESFLHDSISRACVARALTQSQCGTDRNLRQTCPQSREQSSKIPESPTVSIHTRENQDGSSKEFSRLRSIRTSVQTAVGPSLRRHGGLPTPPRNSRGGPVDQVGSHTGTPDATSTTATRFTAICGRTRSDRFPIFLNIFAGP